MTALLPARRRADAFDALVDDLLTGTDQSGGARIADPRLLDLRDLAADLVATRDDLAAAPAAAFTADLRERLLLAAETDLVPADERLLLPHRSPAAPARRHARLSAAVAGLAVVAGTTGVAVASAGSVPGQSLYPVKRGVEEARSALTFSRAAQGRDQLAQADARLAEVSKMLQGEGDQAQVSRTLDAFTDQAGRGADLLFADFRRGGDDDSVDAVREFAGTAMNGLDDLAADSPASLRPALADAARLVVDLDQQARVLCSGCGARAPLQPTTDVLLASSATDNLLDPQLLNARSVPAVPTAGAQAAGVAAAARAARSAAHEKTDDDTDVTLPPIDTTLDQGASGTSGLGSVTTGGTNPLGGLLGGGTGGSSGAGAPAKDPVTELGGTITKVLGGATGTVGSTVGGLGKTLDGSGSQKPKTEKK